MFMNFGGGVGLRIQNIRLGFGTEQDPELWIRIRIRIWIIRGLQKSGMYREAG